MAEFTILTPYPHSPIRAQLEKEGRVLSNNWLDYTADKVVFQPKRMTPEKLREMFLYAWETFYQGGGYQIKMGELFKKIIRREMDDGPTGAMTPGEKGLLIPRRISMPKEFFISGKTTGRDRILSEDVKVIIVIPVYNHGKTLKDIVLRALQNRCRGYGG